MPDVCIVSGSRIDDIAACVIVRKILKANGITSGTPYFANEPAAFLFTPHYRAWRDLGLPIIFVGIPLDPVTMSYWTEIWQRFCNNKNINMPFYFDNRSSSQNTFSEFPYAMVSCGESLARAAYNMAEHLSVNVADYNTMAIMLTKTQNLYTYDETAEKLNVLSYIFPPDSIYISLSLNPNWLDKALSCAVTMQYVERQRDKIEELVIANPEIKVWNLSLGSPDEIKRSFISPEAYVLDRLQAKYDVIFVVAGTNKIKTDSSTPKKIGAPADSINSIVVNSVTRKGIPASYSRQGPVLSFYHKPDFSYYGGDLNQNDNITVYGDGGTVLNDGTSFAAPWIARKLAYLIYKMGLNRETA